MAFEESGSRSVRHKIARLKRSVDRAFRVIVESLEPRSLLSASINRPDHVVVVVEQDRTSDAIGNAIWSYLNSVAATGLVYNNSHGVTHPSTPNSLAMFSGSTQGVTGNGRTLSFGGPNLAKSLFDAGLSFSGYVESLPADGSQVSMAGTAAFPDLYTRNINPMAMFTDLGTDPLTGQPRANATVNRTFGAFSAIPTNDYSSLPTISFVIPNNFHNSHGSNEVSPWAGSADEQNNDVLRESADGWLRDNLDGYLNWARDNNSLLIVTQDEERWTGGTADTITTVVNGDPDLFDPGVNSDNVNHYNLLRTLTDFYGLAPLGVTGSVTPLDHDATGQLLPDVPLQAATTTTLSTSPALSVYAQGSNVTFGANVASSVGAPAGTVTFFDGDVAIGTGNVDASGVATLTTSGLAVGSHSITASYGGSMAHAGSVSNALAVTVDPAPVPPAADAGGPYAAVEGQPVVLSATGTTGTVSLFEWDFDYDGVTFIADATGITATLPGLDGPVNRTVAVRATGTTGETSVDTATVTISNANPTGTLTAGAVVTQGAASKVGFTNVTDPSTADLAGGLKYSFDFNNDGDFIDAGDVVNATSASASFTFAAAGTFNVRGRVTDKDGGFTDYVTAVTVDAPQPPVSTVLVEAESGTFGGGTFRNAGRAGYTGTGYADYGGNGSSAQWSVNRAAAGAVTIAFRYANGDTKSRPLTISVNGVNVGQLPFAPTGSWTTWKTIAIDATLRAGANTIRAVAGVATGANLDSLSITAGTVVASPPPVDVPVTVQAESATRGGGTTVQRLHGGYTGTGYADFGGTNSYVQLVVKRNYAGQATVKLRYANGGNQNRPVSVMVNGVVKIASVTLAKTGGWAKWQEVTFTLDLAAGDNTIRLTSTTKDGVNLDAVTVG